MFQLRATQAGDPLGGTPRGEATPLPENVPTDGAPLCGSPRPKILLADDDPFIRTVLHKALREEFDVVIAEDGIDALTLVLRERPDLIVLDVSLARISGFEVCRSLRACAFDQPVLFLSALFDPAERTRGLSFGGTDFIAKPFQVREVIERIRGASRRCGGLRRAYPKDVELDTLLRAARSRILPEDSFRARLAEACGDVVRFGASLGVVRVRWDPASAPESVERLHHELERLTRPEDLLTLWGAAEAVVVLHTEGRAGTVGFVRKLRREWESGGGAPRPEALPSGLHVGIGIIVPSRDGRAPSVSSALESAVASEDLFENPLYAADRPSIGSVDRSLANGTDGP